MKILQLFAVGVAILAGLLLAPSTRAQQTCGGLVGIPCDEGQFCELPDGHCCCDFFGVCTEIPDACPAVCDPVCGCDGVTYGNRCEASAAAVSVAYTGPCDPLGPAVELNDFTSLDRLFWDPVPEALAYNVYMQDSWFYPPPSNERCLYWAVPESSVLLRGDPEPGQVWMFEVTALFEDGEGSIGPIRACLPGAPASPCTCTLPADVGPCLAVIPRWFNNYITGRCEQFNWGGCGGNANNFETEDGCEAACRNPCDQPAVQGDCTAAVLRWYYNVLTGHCETFSWGGCVPRENNFLTEADCQTRCGDICFLPPDPGDCDGVCPRWFFNPGTAQCEMFIWGCCGGNRNNFASQAECEAECAD